MKRIKFRNIFMSVGVTMALVLGVLMDPDFGYITALPFGSAMVAQLTFMSKAFLFIGLLHYTRKALLDYVDLQVFFNKAKESSEGAGLVVVGVGMIMISIAIIIYTATH